MVVNPSLHSKNWRPQHFAKMGNTKYIPSSFKIIGICIEASIIENTRMLVHVSLCIKMKIMFHENGQFVLFCG